MLIKETYHDVATQAGGKHGTMRIYVIEPNVPEWPEAKFPGVVVFSEVSERDTAGMVSTSKRSRPHGVLRARRSFAGATGFAQLRAALQRLGGKLLALASSIRRNELVDVGTSRCQSARSLDGH